MYNAIILNCRSKMFTKTIYNSLRNYLSECILTSRVNYSSTSSDGNNKFCPVTIDVPWGKIEGKLWGSGAKQPIVAIHGWMDNAGSFDHLVPLLKSSPILTIDLPGHGLSSWVPPGITYDSQIFAQSIRRIAKHYGWGKTKLLGHSMGGMVCYKYAHLYPSETQFVISIDSLTFQARRDAARYAARQASAIDGLLRMEKKYVAEPPSYPEAKVIENWVRASEFQSLDVPAVKTLMIRGCRRKPDGSYVYTRDPRLKIEGFSLNPFYSVEQVQRLSELITCPYLLIRASRNTFKNVEDYWRDGASTFKKRNPNYYEVMLEGTHHLHMQNSKAVADAINKFLEKHDK